MHKQRFDGRLLFVHLFTCHKNLYILQGKTTSYVPLGIRSFWEGKG